MNRRKVISNERKKNKQVVKTNQFNLRVPPEVLDLNNFTLKNKQLSMRGVSSFAITIPPVIVVHMGLVNHYITIKGDGERLIIEKGEEIPKNAIERKKSK